MAMTKIATACIAAVCLITTSALLAQQRPLLQKADAHQGSGGALTCQEQVGALTALVDNYRQQIVLLKTELTKLESNDAAEPETR
jgi:hypothetical protein